MASSSKASFPPHPMGKDRIKEILLSLPDLQKRVNTWMRTGYIEVKRLNDAEGTCLVIKGAYQEYDTPQIVVTVSDRTHRETYHHICPRELGCDPHYDEFRQQGKLKSDQYRKELDERHAKEAAEVEERIRKRKEQQELEKKESK